MTGINRAIPEFLKRYIYYYELPGGRVHWFCALYDPPIPYLILCAVSLKALLPKITTEMVVETVRDGAAGYEDHQAQVAGRL